MSFLARDSIMDVLSPW